MRNLIFKHSKQIILYLQEIFSFHRIVLVDSIQAKHLVMFIYD